MPIGPQGIQYLFDLDNAFFDLFENQINRWIWNKDNTYSIIPGDYVPVVFPDKDPRLVDRLREHEINDPKANITYPFIVIEPLDWEASPNIETGQVYADKENIYIGVKRVGHGGFFGTTLFGANYGSNFNLISGYDIAQHLPPVRADFPYRVTAVSNMWYDHRLLEMILTMKIFPPFGNKRWWDMGYGFVVDVIQDKADTIKDPVRRIFQLSLVYHIFITVYLDNPVKYASILGSNVNIGFFNKGNSGQLYIVQ